MAKGKLPQGRGKNETAPYHLGVPNGVRCEQGRYYYNSLLVSRKRRGGVASSRLIIFRLCLPKVELSIDYFSWKLQ